MASTLFVSKEYVSTLKTAMRHRQKKIRERALVRLEKFHETPVQEHGRLESEVNLNSRLNNNCAFIMNLRMRMLKEEIRRDAGPGEMGGADERFN
jgi:hypothetical protein